MYTKQIDLNVSNQEPSIKKETKFIAKLKDNSD